MTTIAVSKFHRGMADDYQDGGVGEFSVSKHFDILSNPKRLQPLRGMVTDTAGTKIGNMLTATDGLIYGLGTDVANPTLGTVWSKVGYGASDAWTQRGTNGGYAVVYGLFVDYPAQTNTRNLIFAVSDGASNKKIIAMRGSDGNSDTSQTLSFATIGQGLVFPTTPTILYIPYDNKIAIYTGATITAAQFTIGSQYTIPCLSFLANYLAIPAYSGSGSGVQSSLVHLWDRDLSNTLPNQTVPWGQGQLKVLNNLGGVLIGVSTLSANYNGSVQDSDSILIKIYEGGAEPTLIKEIKATRLTSTAPSVAINPNVNFIYKNRLYFSVNIVNGGTAPAYYGLWSVGRNKLTGEWAVTLERVATNDNSETGVLAAAIAGDFVSMVHTTVGTIVSTINGNSLSSIYGATSVYESSINQDMTDLDKEKQKQLMAVYATYLPLPVDASVVMKYRVDSSANGAWTTIFTETTDGITYTERQDASGVSFTDGRKYEFRLESVGGAIITGWGYKYDSKVTLI